MGSKQIRLGHLIAPFGPGSLYTDSRGIPHIICGLDHWHQRYDESTGFQDCDSLHEFLVFEPRLAELLRVDQFRSPPDYRAVRKGWAAPLNAMLTIPALRFPTWYRHTATGDLKQFNLDTTRIPPASGGGRWQPVRFVSVCENGHLGDFPWKEWIDCECIGDTGIQLIDSGGSELSSIRVRCTTCPDGSLGRKGKTLAGTTIRPNPLLNEKSAFEKAGIRCHGERPWLGDGAEDCGCTAPLVAALINQTNLYFPKTVSAILIPQVENEGEHLAVLRNEILDLPEIGVVKSLWSMNHHEMAANAIITPLKKKGIEAEFDNVLTILKSVFECTGVMSTDDVPEGLESELLAFRRSEFNVLRREINDPERIRDLCVIPAGIPKELKNWVSRVNLVERLRETRVFLGFNRLETQGDVLKDMPEVAMKQLFRKPRESSMEQWLPASVVYGEGIYIELEESAIKGWQQQNDAWLKDRIDDRFISRVAAVQKTLPPLGLPSMEWASRFLLVHSLTHVLINQLVFECGYSTAALRERLFVSADPSAPMAGLMIYTASGDSEGTMGGLVRLGRPDQLAPLMKRALARAQWCSADPVCSENLGGQGSQLANLAACHACCLLAETSCETINHGLDRAMVVGTPERRDAGFMSALLKGYMD